MADPFTDSFYRALQGYVLQFPTLGSLGSGNPPVAWYAEYLAVKKDAQAQVLVNATSGPDGAQVSGMRNFSGETKEDALHIRRWQLDSTYPLPAHLANFPAAATARATSGRGFRIKFGP